jgi:hypothetical protein
LSFSDFSNFYYSIANTDSYWSTNNFLLNNSFLNWIVVLLMFIIVNTLWRLTIQKSMYLFNTSVFGLTSLVFYILFSFLI